MEQKVPSCGIAEKVSDVSCHSCVQMMMTHTIRAAQSHGGKYVKDFARQMWMQLGMRVMVFSAHIDTEGNLCLAT
jgi:hypothetical protein